MHHTIDISALHHRDGALSTVLAGVLALHGAAHQNAEYHPPVSYTIANGGFYASTHVFLQAYNAPHSVKAFHTYLIN